MQRSGTNPAVASVSAFFPCYNDLATIGGLVDTVTVALEKLGFPFEVIVVDDGSTDDSVELLRALEKENEHLRVIEHERNRGYGGALRTGFEAAQNQWVFYTDGDGQYDPAEVIDLVEAATTDVDFVQGWKIDRGDNIVRVVVGRAYHHTVRLFFDLDIKDTDCDFRLIRKTLLDRVTLEYDSGVVCAELMRSFRDVGARFVERPVHHYPRPVGQSEFFNVRQVTHSLRDLANLWVDRVFRQSRR